MAFDRQGSMTTAAATKTQVAGSSKPAKAAGGQLAGGKSSKPVLKVLRSINSIKFSLSLSLVSGGARAAHASFMHVFFLQSADDKMGLRCGRKQREDDASGGGGAVASSSEQEGPRTPDPKMLRRLAQNREAARKSRLRKEGTVIHHIAMTSSSSMCYELVKSTLSKHNERKSLARKSN
jgi:hypothetical protein